MAPNFLDCFCCRKRLPTLHLYFALQHCREVVSSANKLYKQKKCRNRYRRNIGAVSGCLLFAKPVVSFFSLSTASSFLKQAFEGEYPKLLRLYNELWRRLQQYSTSLQGALTNVGGMDTSVDIASAEMDSQDLFTHGKENYKWADTQAAEGVITLASYFCRRDLWVERFKMYVLFLHHKIWISI